MEIRAPLSGVIVPLEVIPDPVFAGKMVGDGVALDPTSDRVLAPIAGRISQLHASRHALAVTSDEGVEVLIHVGLDTVYLQGRGFEPRVAVGDRVAVGQELLRFDPEVVGAAARSLLTEVVVTSGERARITSVARGMAVAGETTLLTLELVGAAAHRAEGETVEGAPISLPNPEGLHARPAAVLAGAARRYGAEIELLRGPDRANAKSVVAVMAMGTQRGDRVHLRARGHDAAAAVAALSTLLREGCGETAEAAPAAQQARPEPAAVGAGEIAGQPAASGLAVGRVHHLRRVEPEVPKAGATVAEEQRRLASALEQARSELVALKEGARETERRDIVEAQLALLDDPDLAAVTQAGLSSGDSAAWVWRAAYLEQAARLEALASPILRERAADVRDVGRRVLGLLGIAATAPTRIPAESVLVAEELSPTELLALPAGQAVALCTRGGSATSHVAILARNLSIPAVCGIEDAAFALPEGTRVVVDGTRGVLRVNPDEAAMALYRERIARDAAARAAERVTARALARTEDGHRVEVAANISGVADAKEAVAAGAEAVGLLRSEFLFMGREAAPDEDEQAAVYEAVAEVLGAGRRFVVRTLDVGGDKPIAYLPLPKEPNPFLGVRGIRVSLEHPELFRTQLRAMARAARFGNLHIMFPMISGVDEVRAARKFVDEVLGDSPHPVKVGVMIEVPSAAVMAEVLAREVDFFSIGTNDLTQYTLAMDRGHARLAKKADALHPAVLRLIARTVEGAHAHGRWVGVCGGIASDPVAAPVLVGLGVDELSVSVPAIPSVKATIGRWRKPDCVNLAREALGLGTAQQVRELLERRQMAPVVEARVPAPVSKARVEG
ncbi:MAG: phosphoenolpyruvate--protein phosphotransferase [Myxococcales bacterium]|nr:phosphoenolpyruvate--protein phosphotransferase [Myxococcales bacterium]